MLSVVTFPFLIIRLADFPRVPATQIWQHDPRTNTVHWQEAPKPFAKKAVRMWLEQKGVRAERHVPIGGQTQFTRIGNQVDRVIWHVRGRNRINSSGVGELKCKRSDVPKVRPEGRVP